MPCVHSGGGSETISSRPWAPCAVIKSRSKSTNTNQNRIPEKGNVTHKSSSRASDSRSSREGWEVWWKSCSSMASWVPVKRFRERFVVVGLGALKRRSSEEEPRLDDDSERKRLAALMGAMKRRAERSHNGFIQVRGCVKQTRRVAHVNTPTRTLSRDRV